MAVFITLRVKGNEAALTRAYDAIADYEETHVPELRCHVCARTGDGILVSGVWQSREAFDRLMRDPGFQRVLREQNVPAPEVEVFEVYRSRH